MPDEIQRGGRRTKKITTAEAKIELEKQESKPAEPEAASTRQESMADGLLRNIFFRSGPLPMSPD